MSLVADVFGFNIQRPIVPDDKLLLPDVRVGFELEYENYYPSDRQCGDLVHWVSDGSLREGGEFIFKRPLAGVEVMSALTDISYQLQLHERSFSYRTSAHVHIDVRDLSTGQYIKMLYVYALIEPTLFKLFPERVGNPYCKPVIDHIEHGQGLHVLKDLLSNSSFSSINSWDKYSAINLRSTSVMGSLEFRIFTATDNPNRMLEYVNLAMFSRYAIGLSEPDEVYNELANLTLDGVPIVPEVNTEVYDMFKLLETKTRGLSWRGHTQEDDYDDDYLSDYDSYESGADVVEDDEEVAPVSRDWDNIVSQFVA